MRVKIEFSCDNAAFEGDEFGAEAARILRQMAAKIDGLPMGRVPEIIARDSNGNRVGDLELTDD